MLLLLGYLDVKGSLLSGALMLINRNTSFEPLSVQIGPKLMHLWAGRGNGKKEKRREKESHITVIFHHHVEAPFRNR